ncbi:hypothetical protein EV126DRAFT_430448 [Verticillium dahliae]|nr:hypothetical protein EV126DRAFT_430448 [Verticillium dahliae]
MVSQAKFVKQSKPCHERASCSFYMSRMSTSFVKSMPFHTMPCATAVITGSAKSPHRPAHDTGPRLSRRHGMVSLQAYLFDSMCHEANAFVVRVAPNLSQYLIVVSR